MSVSLMESHQMHGTRRPNSSLDIFDRPNSFGRTILNEIPNLQIRSTYLCVVVLTHQIDRGRFQSFSRPIRSELGRTNLTTEKGHGVEHIAHTMTNDCMSSRHSLWAHSYTCAARRRNWLLDMLDKNINPRFCTPCTQ